MSSVNDDDNVIQLKQVELVTIILSIISLLFSLSVVFILLFKYQKLLEGKVLIHHVLNIAVSDTFVGIAFGMGYPSPGRLCTVQGLIGETFEKASWFWTCSLMYNIYSIMLFGKFAELFYTFIFIWGVVLMLSLLPFVNVSYGYSGTSQRCRFSIENYDKANQWSQFQSALGLCSLFFIVCMTLRVAVFSYFKKSINKEQSNSNLLLNYMQTRATEAFETMIWYPLAFFVTWLPSQLYNQMVPNSTTTRQILLRDYFQMIAPLYGCFLAIIFYTKTADARSEWIKIFFRTKNNYPLANET
jgi:hypothetical protein